MSDDVKDLLKNGNRIDKDGTIWEPTGILSEKAVGKVDKEGIVWKETGVFASKPVGNIDDKGVMWQDTGIFASKPAGRVDSNGNVYHNTGVFAEKPAGKIGGYERELRHPSLVTRPRGSIDDISGGGVGLPTGCGIILTTIAVLVSLLIGGGHCINNEINKIREQKNQEKAVKANEIKNAFSAIKSHSEIKCEDLDSNGKIYALGDKFYVMRCNQNINRMYLCSLTNTKPPDFFVPPLVDYCAYDE
ncbi:hypothetical protein KY308_03180 [Candidatus Woesearchaeota archaeon]|nr:hypothetical protein [Candidatus Woesearchaeota archaeon]